MNIFDDCVLITCYSSINVWLSLGDLSSYAWSDDQGSLLSALAREWSQGAAANHVPFPARAAPLQVTSRPARTTRCCV